MSSSEFKSRVFSLLVLKGLDNGSLVAFKRARDRKTGHKDGTKMTQTLNLHLNRNKKDTIVNI